MPVMMEPYAGAWHTVYALTPAPEVEDARVQREKKHGEALLAKTCRPFQRNGMETISMLARGDAATEIMHYAQSNQIDLIVAGSLGMSNLRSLWVGSVSRKLVHYSDCSVLLVKGPKEA
jgi:nucleotide-binding universal stress UspA family protein